MIYDVVHIGLGKAMSTTLQGLWRASPLYHCVDATVIGPGVADLLVAAKREGRAPAPMRLNAPPNPGRPVSLLTTEVFTFSIFKDRPHLFRLIAERQQYMAQNFGACGRCVLLVVRNPLDWVRSAHAHYVKKGGAQSCADYVHSYRPSLLQNLDLVHIVEVWRAANPSLVILPMEMYLEDQAAFWALYTRLLGVPAPLPLRAPSYQNRSHYDRLALSAHLNGLLGELGSLLQPVNASYAKAAADGLSVARNWGVRRVMENASEAQVQALSGRLGFTPDPGFLDWEPDQEFLAHIDQRFLPPLREVPHLAPWLPAYAAAVAADATA